MCTYVSQYLRLSGGHGNPLDCEDYNTLSYTSLAHMDGIVTARLAKIDCDRHEASTPRSRMSRRDR